MILDLPDEKKPYASLFDLSSTSDMVENNFNPAVQVGEGDQYWTGELEYQNTERHQTLVFRSFIQKLNGTAGEFWFFDYTHQQRGSWQGNAVVQGNNQDGTMLTVSGLQVSARVGEIGDRFQLGDHMYELTEPADTNHVGIVSLKFNPDIRVIPTHGQALNTTNPRCKCMLYPKQKIPQPTAKKALLSGFKFKFRESLR